MLSTFYRQATSSGNRRGIAGVFAAGNVPVILAE
jgi:hypothetical protein